MKRLLLLFFFIINSFAWTFLPHSENSRPKIKVNIWDKNQFDNKKFISITPGGIAGFYSLGISSYILNNYDVSNYSFIGASAGAWISLVCCYKHDHNKLIKDLLELDIFDNCKGSISKLQYDLYSYLTENYKTEDFDFDKLHICISELKKTPTIVTNFNSLEKAIDCCIVSSHIPYITSDQFIKKFDNKVVFDGGFSEFPPKSVYNHVVISPNKYDNISVGAMLMNIINKNISNEVVKHFYYLGYDDTTKDKINLDNIFDINKGYINTIDNDFELFSPFNVNGYM